MIQRIAETDKPHTLFLERDSARFCEVESDYAKLWMSGSSADSCVGTYGIGASFTDVMTDVMAMDEG